MSRVTKAQEVKARHREELLSDEAVVGLGIDEDEQGRERILIYVHALTPEVERRLPKALDGVPVVVEAVGRIVPRDSI